MRRLLKAKVLIPLVALLALLGFGLASVIKNRNSNTDKYLASRVERGTVKYTVSATGTLQAVITVQVGSQVTGRIQELYADFNTIVKKGQILARIDPSNFEAQKQRAEAALATAEAAVKSAEALLANRRAELTSAKANLEAARVARDDARRILKRTQELYKDGLVPERDLEAAQAAAEQADARYNQVEAQVKQAEAQVRSAAAQLEQAKAQVLEARASLEMAEVNLKYTVITSPIDGVVIERNVDVGQTVAASLQAPTLFIIANDLSRMQVTANIDEADIGAVSENAAVEFTVDAFPGEIFRGKISEIRLNAKTQQNVVTYNVIIDVDNPQLKLRPGMTANVNFTVARVDNVLKVPNAALRFRPSDLKPEDLERMLDAAIKGEKPQDRAAASADASQARWQGLSKEERTRWRERMAELAARRMQGDGPERGFPRGDFDPSRWRRMRESGSPAAGQWGGFRPSMMAAAPTVVVERGEKIHFPKAEVVKPRWQVVWVLNDKKMPEPRRIKTGITDGRATAVLDGELKEGDLVIIGDSGSLQGQPPSQSVRSPFPGGSPFRVRR